MKEVFVIVLFERLGWLGLLQRPEEDFCYSFGECKNYFGCKSSLAWENSKSDWLLKQIILTANTVANGQQKYVATLKTFSCGPGDRLRLIFLGNKRYSDAQKISLNEFSSRFWSVFSDSSFIAFVAVLYTFTELSETLFLLRVYSLVLCTFDLEGKIVFIVE